MNKVIVTIDLDWASEAAIAQTLDYFAARGFPVTVFATHHSDEVVRRMDHLRVGLHPFFGVGSSHGRSIAEVVEHIMAVPHNLRAFRAHQFAVCNASLHAMFNAGMRVSSNVCADVQCIAPFMHRSGLMELPVFVEDGGYLWRNHPLQANERLTAPVSCPKVLLIHPMHFVVNTPNFHFMREIKDSLDRDAWRCLDQHDIRKMAYTGRGIRDVMTELIEQAGEVVDLSDWVQGALAQQNPLLEEPL